MSSNRVSTNCAECGQEFGIFEYFVPVFQTRLSDSAPERVGYVHIWHLRNHDPQP